RSASGRSRDSSVIYRIRPTAALRLRLDCVADSRSGVAGECIWGVRSMGGRGRGARTIARAVARSVPLVATVVLIGAACSKSSSSTEATTIFVQKFRYHGLPTTLKSGIHQFVF